MGVVRCTTRAVSGVSVMAKHRRRLSHDRCTASEGVWSTSSSHTVSRVHTMSALQWRTGRRMSLVVVHIVTMLEP